MSLGAALIIAPLGVGVAALDVRAQQADVGARPPLWLEVERPYQGWVEIGLNPLLIVRGSAGTARRRPLDLVIALDASRSTRDSAGVDVNGDGHVGGVGWAFRRDAWSYLRHPQTSSDPGDSILSAALVAIDRLSDKLLRGNTRIGIVRFREHAAVRASLTGDADRLRRQIGQLAGESPEGRTNLAVAIETALRALREGAHDAAPGAESAILLLSDGKPTVPAPEARAAAAALEAADEAARLGVRIYTVGLGVPDEESTTLKRIADRTAGAYAALASPGDIIEALPRIDLQALADIDIRNLTTGRRARALRVWADGSYDAYVKLQPGKNRLRIRGRDRDGSERVEERYVYFERISPRNEEQRRLANRRLAELRDLLQDRSVVLEVEREMASVRDRRERDRSLVVEPE